MIKATDRLQACIAVHGNTCDKSWPNNFIVYIGLLEGYI